VNPQTLPILLIVWGLWLVTALQSALAVRGWLVERREGMRVSRLRLLTLIIIFVINTAMTLTSTLLPPRLRSSAAASQAPAAPAVRPSPSPAAAPDDPRTKEIKRQLEALNGEVAALDKKRQEVFSKAEELRKQLPAAVASADPAAAAAPTPAPPLISEQSLILGSLIVVALLVMFGFVALMTAGQLQSLFPQGWSPLRGAAAGLEDSKAELERLTSAVWAKDYARGLAVARRIQPKRLEHFDRLDYLFLRTYCAVQLLSGDDSPADPQERREYIDRAVEDLESVVEETPNRAEAVYLLGLAYGMSGDDAKALRAFRHARELLPRSALPFDHQESVCLLRLAEKSLSEGDTERAEEHFGGVTKLAVLADQVVESRARIGLIGLHEALNRRDVRAAEAALVKLESLLELKPEQRLQIEIISSAFNARVALREQDPERTLALTTAFIDRHTPPNLPKPDEEAADETLGSLVGENDLPFPREVLRGFLFLQAVALCKLEARKGVMLTEPQVKRLSEPLLRGLQFDPRQRDLLAALGGLYYWFRKDWRKKALEWLEAAALMGVVSRIVPRILERDRLYEMERREALDWFRSASARFLRDPSLAGEVRSALVEELGRFQEFEPLLISLEQKPDLEQEEPTLETLKERARYLAQLVADISGTGRQAEQKADLAQLRNQYLASLETLERTTDGMAELERRVVKELGKMLSLGETRL
jgi:predicted DCC family thiol-disulfide oxidoreductase YuxK